MPITVGVIGCGNIARFHLLGLQQAKARIAWTCDLDPVWARDRAAACGAKPTTDWREVVADPDVQALFVTTVSRAHREICLAAIAAGTAVVCEKTLAERREEAAEIVAAARAAGTLFWTSYTKRFIPAVELAKRLLPGLGDILLSNVRAWQCWGDLWSAAPVEGFFHTPPGGQSTVRRNYGGGILVCGGSHLLDLICHLHGRPRRVYAEMAVPQDRDYDLRANALFTTDAGPVHMQALAHPLGRTGLLGDGWDEQIEIIGTRGRLLILSSQWDAPESKASVLIHEDADGVRHEHRPAPPSPFTRAVEHFCTCIAAGSQGPQPVTTGYDVDELITHIQRSAHEGRALGITYHR